MITIEYRCCNLCLTCTEGFPDIFQYNHELDKVMVAPENAKNLKVKLDLLERICPRGCITVKDD